MALRLEICCIHVHLFVDVTHCYFCSYFLHTCCVSIYECFLLLGLKNYGALCELRMTTSQPSSREDTHTRCLHANLLWVCEFQQCLKTDPVYDWEKKHSLKGICELRMTTRVEIGKPELHCSIGHHTRNLHSDRPPNSCGPDVHDCKKQSLSIFFSGLIDRLVH